MYVLAPEQGVKNWRAQTIDISICAQTT